MGRNIKKFVFILAAVCFFLFAAAGCAAQERADDKEEESSVAERMILTIDNQSATVLLAENAAAEALVARLRQGEIRYTADDYGGFEKVGDLGFTLPRDDSRIQTQPGDVILYQGRQIVLFYGSNTFSYTRLGRIEGLALQQLEDFLCAGRGSVSVTLSLGR